MLRGKKGGGENSLIFKESGPIPGKNQLLKVKEYVCNNVIDNNEDIIKYLSITYRTLLLLRSAADQTARFLAGHDDVFSQILRGSTARSSLNPALLKVKIRRASLLKGYCPALIH